MIFFLFDDKTEPADIFAEIPSEKPTSVPPQTPGGAAPVPQIAAPATGVVLQQAAFGKKGILILALVVVLIGGGAAAYFSLSGSKTPAEPAVQIPEPQLEPQPEPQPQPQPEPQPEPQPQPQPEIDSDGDGLSDTREAQLGTNAGMVDTDNDGLSDREEVEVYMTDPNNSDTDADTFKDGDEIRNGYNPKGPGKLLEIPPAP